MPFTSDDSAVSADAVAGSGGLSESPGRVAAGPTALDWRPISPVAMSADQVAREIDRVLSDVWRKQGIKPAAPAGKANLMRRLYLDLTGRMPPATIAQLREYVRLGGGLWVALGPRTDVRDFNQSWFRDSEGLSPAAIDRIVNMRQSDSHTGINPLLPAHPATQQLADVQRLDLGEIKVARRHRFTAADTHHSTLLESVSGEPLATAASFGRGRVFLLGVPLRLQWTELVLSRSFVVMVQDWLAWLSAPSASRHNLEASELISLIIEDDNFLNTAGKLVDPYGDEFAVESNESQLGMAYSFRAHSPGTYWLTPDHSARSIAFHVSRPVAESNLSPLSAGDRTFFVDMAGLSLSSEPEPFVISDHDTAS